MRLTGWTWLIFGAIIAVMSGYIYLFIPKDGQPNNAMALFFFIGMLFIIMGIIKILFKRVDDKEIFDSVEQAIQKKGENIIQMPIVENRTNKIDEAINQMASRQTQGHHQTGQQHPIHAQAHQAPANKAMHHTNTYSQLHQYKGPVHTPNTGAHAQHPIAQHSHHATPSQTHVAAHHVQNVSEHSLRCGKCGNINSGHSNYCHQCGGRLK